MKQTPPSQPRNTVLREAQPTQDSTTTLFQSLNKPKPSPSPSPSRRHNKASKENAPPPSDLLPSTSRAAAKINSSPLPPRPALKRKLSLETVTDSSVVDSGVKVIVRMRPLSKDEKEGEMILQKIADDSLSINGQTFTFDSVADTNATQLDIFELVGVPLVENCLAGFNSSVFAYGQTGSGKTYTMWGPANALSEENLLSDQQGLTPRVFQRLFARISEEQMKHSDKQLKYQCRCSFLEIYNEQITDLLDPNQKNLQIREDVKSGVYVENLTEEYVFTMKDVSQLLIKSLSNRRTGATSINAESSRSHSVFTCVVESRCKSMADGISSLKTSRINLVDLAGSERQKLTGAIGERLKEAGNINRSLSQLGNLINILAEVSQTGKQRHIPYRDSRLTFLLQESLGGNARLAMVCAVSPAQGCKSETFSTLRFAQRAKAIKNRAVVNEEMEDDVNHLREVIRQLRDELWRVKANNSNPTGWDPRKSLNLLKSLINPPKRLARLDEDGDEEMEIDYEAVENLSIQVGLPPAGTEDGSNNIESTSLNKHVSEDTDVVMEADISEQVEKPKTETVDCDEVVTDSSTDIFYANESEKPSGVTRVGGPDCALVAYDTSNSQLGVVNCVSPSSLSVVPFEVSPVLKSPTLSASPRVNSSRKSLRTLSTQTASQKDVKFEIMSDLEDSGAMSCSSSNPLSSQAHRSFALTAHLAASLHRGLEIIEGNHKSAGYRRSYTRFSYKRSEYKSMLLIDKVNVGVQTLPLNDEMPQVDQGNFLCSICKNKNQMVVKAADTGSSMQLVLVEGSNTQLVPTEGANVQLVPVDGSDKQFVSDSCSNMQLISADILEPSKKSKNQVPKAVEKVLAGAIRREMALEEFCAKQTSEIRQLNRLLQQYRHERECNALITQTREDKIIRLESLMDGVLPTEDFIEEEFASLTHEHQILKEKYENHSEVQMANIELKRVQDELEQYRNLYDLGEREVLLEEIQDLRCQLQYYIDSSSSFALKRNSLLKLTYLSEPNLASPLGSIPEPTDESAEQKLEQESLRWAEAESQWISLAEELRAELDACRALSERKNQELATEKACADEWKEAMQMAMEGHARMLEQYADLEEKHIQLLARHRKIREGIDDVKKAASKAGVKGAESKFINALAAEISALKAEREKERRCLRDENRSLQSQLRETAEAVQAAGELLLRLKESEEAVAIAQKRAMDAEQEAVKANRQIDKLKKKHEHEMGAPKELLAGSRLPKEATKPAHNDLGAAKYDIGDPLSKDDQRWKEEFAPFYNAEDGELPKLGGPWFSSYDRCNI